MTYGSVDYGSGPYGDSPGGFISPGGVIIGGYSSVWTFPQYPDWQVLAAFGFGPLDPAPVWTDITDYMRGFTYEDGRQHELDRVEAGELALTLNDRFGEFTPGNTLSPYYNLLSLSDSLGLNIDGGTWHALSGGAIGSESGTTIWGPLGGYFTGSAAGDTTFAIAGGTDGYAVTAGDQYTFSVWIKAQTTAESLTANIRWYDSSGSPISASAGVAGFDSTASWVQFTVTGAAPSPAAFAQLQIYNTNHTVNTHYFTCCLLSYNPHDVPVGWSQGQQNPLVPCVPIWVKGAWDGITRDQAYTFADSWVPIVTDVLNQDMKLTGYDVLGLLGLAPLSNSLLFPNQILEFSPVGYWRLNDAIGSYSAASYIGGSPLTATADEELPPDFGSQDTTGAGLAALLSSSFSGSGSGAILYDPATAATFVGVQASTSLPQGLTGSGLFSGDQAWSLYMLVNFGTEPGAIVFNSENIDAARACEIFVADSTEYPDNLDQLCVSINSGLTFAASGVSVLDGNWHSVAVTSGANGSRFYLILDDVLVIDEAISSSTTPITFALTGSSLSSDDSPSTAVQDFALFGTQLSSPDTTAIYDTYHLLQDYDFTGERISKVLTIAGYNTFPQDLALGTVICQPETTSQTQTAALDYIQNVVDTELGFFRQTTDGVLRFNDANYALTNEASATSQGILGDNLDADMFYIPQGLKTPQDSLDLWTDIQVQANQNVGAGAMQEIVNTAAIGPPGGFGRRVLQRTGLLFSTDAQTLAQANLLAARYNTPKKRVDGVTLKAEASGGVNIPFMLGMSLWDRVTFQRQGSRESQFSADMLIEHRSFSFQADPGEYAGTWVLSPYEVPPVSLSLLAVGDSLYPGGPAPSPLGTPYFEQSGIEAVTFSSGVGELTFPVPYPNGLLSVEVIVEDSETHVNSLYLSGTASLSNVQLVFVQNSDTYSGTAGISFRAIGW